MKYLFVLVFIGITFNLLAQEIPEEKVKTSVKDVTVFLKGAQITRRKNVKLPKGKSVVRFTGLSPFIDAKSIKVKVGGEVIVLSVSHEQNYSASVKKDNELVELENEVQKLQDKIEIISLKRSIILERVSFLKDNKVISGSDQTTSVNDLQSTYKFYSDELTSLMMEKLDLDRQSKELEEDKKDLNDKIKKRYDTKEYPTGEVLVSVDSKKEGTFLFELAYLVSNASWFPSYDIRANNIEEPISLTYKANVKQDTKVSWDNVSLKLSSADPNVSGVAPKLKTYFLDYYTLPPSYKNVDIERVTGVVLDENGAPMPGVNILIEGTTIGTISDIDGKYDITIPNYAQSLKFSFIGYKDQLRTISRNALNVTMELDESLLEEVVVVGYGESSDIGYALSGAVAGVNVERGVRVKSNLSDKRNGIPITQVERQTSVDFTIKRPYSINSDNKKYTVDIDAYLLDAQYHYYSVPKINKDAFLIASVTNWEAYNLLEGEANLFFEGTYIGKTVLDVKYASDTMQISLGRDKQISVSRKKVRDFTNKQFIGSKKEISRAYEIVIKNNKSQEIDITIDDQIPVSTMQEIEVTPIDISSGEFAEETGSVSWDIILKPSESKKIEFKYSVKHPKNKNLTVE
ncbi:mucoidy inhibitor MuiA family protein [Reichenbachiella versicolor]|uniref:mucoidy inhibitor MuiA family protein n=1 Tax=Reichenbachiella versicolor TaxID=1821036 RepID=UPI000D6E3100|nr:mucoidy inhibitor MuiA family protein [Reichenbachiella versicolor]